MTEQAPLVLVIDDEEVIRDSCSQILLKFGYRVETSADGASGIRKIETLKPEAAIIDLKMPGTSGFEVLEAIPRLDPHLTAIVITGYATVDSAVEAMKKGAYDFLPKPFTPEELRVILARGLERRQLVLEAEALRREKKALEENFITMVSHQLRSPVVAAQQYLSLILAGIVSDPGKLREMIAKSSERLDGLLRLIDDWLNLACIDQGSLVGKLKPVALRRMLARVIETLDPSARESSVSLEWPDRDDPEIVAAADEESLEQAVMNLVHNAIKYNRPQGSVRLGLRQDGAAVVLEVEDTGIGIAREHLPFIFDQFFRVSRASRESLRGSGLGLCIVKKIVEAHQGRIEVQSEPGVGTTFTVVLPLEPSRKDRA
ncbi:MAG: hypothetical protein A2Y56_01035 [Candidatus Aminicenantes bacterium RBG_13_63_10]|nr:MAG: hypothetical protein A2Y56_01035 [Candidatus Aminicenantes bacterium RBG_13_63_10]